MSELRSQVENVLSVLLMTDGEEAPLTRLFLTALSSESEAALEHALDQWFSESDQALEARLARVASTNAEGILERFALSRAAAAAILELAHSPDWARLVASSRAFIQLPPVQQLTPLEQARAVLDFDEVWRAFKQTPRRVELVVPRPGAVASH